MPLLPCLLGRQFVQTLLDAGLVDGLVDKARTASRRRCHHNLHTDLNAPAQRLLVAMEPDSYVRPHCHLDPNKSETIIPLRGRLGALVFDGEGKVLEARVIAPEAGSFGFHVPAGVFHSIVALESGTVFIEIIFSLDGLGLLGFEAAFQRRL